VKVVVHAAIRCLVLCSLCLQRLTVGLMLYYVVVARADCGGLVLSLVFLQCDHASLRSWQSRGSLLPIHPKRNADHFFVQYSARP